MTPFAERLKKVRTAKNLSQTELGGLIGVHYTQIGRYENKGAYPTADVLAKMSNALGVSSDYLINGTSDDLADSSLTDKELLNQFKKVQAFDSQDRDVVKILIDAFITKKQVQKLAS
jgi:transcriptional regulator with XRE-family HTH domain